MKHLFILLYYSLLLTGQTGQQQLMISQKISASGGTWTLVNSVADRAVAANKLTCVAAVCTLTVPSTGTGNGLIVQAMNTNGVSSISTVTGGGTWVVPAGCHVTSGPVGGQDAAYALSSSSGTTSVVITFSASPGDTALFYREVSWSGSSISFDVCGTASRASATTSAGPTLTLTGTSYSIGQICSQDSGRPTSITSPYNTNFVNVNDAAASLGFTAGTVALNQSAGTAPTWTLSASAATLVQALSLKGN